MSLRKYHQRMLGKPFTERRTKAVLNRVVAPSHANHVTREEASTTRADRPKLGDVFPQMPKILRENQDDD